MTDPTMTEEYRNADNGSASLIGVSFALLALTTIFVVLLLVSRYYKETSVPPLMFWLILLAYVFNTGNAIDNALSAILGDAGKHVSTLDHATNIVSGKIGKAADYLYVPSSVLPKLAMLSFFHQVFPGKIYRYLIYANATLLVGTLAAGLLQTTFICRPFSAYWTGEGKCGDLLKSYKWLSYPNLLTDFVMLIMPALPLWKLQVNLVTKVKLIVTFLTGSLGIITAILRMVSFHTVPIFSDPTWYLIEPSIYSVVEPSAYLICTIMPTLRHLTRRIARVAGFSTSSGYTTYDNASVSRHVRSKLNSKALTGSKAPERDIEMQGSGERGWSKIERGTDGGREEIALGGIVCKTDITTYVEHGDSMPWRKNKKDREESSTDDKSSTGARDGFGDEVPLQVTKTVSRNLAR